MAPTRGRLEGRLTVPTGGWSTTINAATATVPAGNYYLSDLLVEVGARFATAGATTCTATASLGESGTGIVTITFGSAKSITWVATDLRDILGFAGNSTSATSHIGTLHARGAWLPTCPYKAPNEIGANWQGWREGHARTVGNHAGYTWTHMGQERVATWLEWPSVKRSRTWTAHEATANESWERFVRDVIWGVPAWGNASGPVRFFPDAANNGTFATYRVADASHIKPEPVFADYAGGPWTVRLSRLVKVPA